ncbi:MAG TPA: hypothetical protein VLV83_01445 [Acidobacteriota bacterium]|nr:hypothetical protein [Acidobacteriota bacterium]
MPAEVLLLDDLTPSEALALLDEAELEAGSLTALRMSVATSAAFGAAVTLAFPLQQASSPGLQRLAHGYQRRQPRGPRRESAASGALPMTQALPWLLLNADTQAVEPADALDDEFLLAAHDFSPDALARLFDSAALHATSVRVAAGESAAGTHHLFHLRADRRRRSSVASALSGEAFEQAVPLAGYETEDEGRVFLPLAARVGHDDLQSFARLLKRLLEALPENGGVGDGSPPPSSSGQGTQSDRSESPLEAMQSKGTQPGRAAEAAVRPGTRLRPPASLRIAVMPAPSAADEDVPDRYLVLDLSRLRFRSSLTLAPPQAFGARFRLLRLSDSGPAMRRLEALLREQAPESGYRLELTETPLREPSEVERIRLRERQAELEYQLALLDSISAPQLRLLRFDPDQLPALAEVLRAFPRSVLRSGALQYAFQAVENEPLGRHYLLIDSNQASMSELDPLLLWERPERPPMRFWMDPSFARDYASEQTLDHLVFVPEGTALFPPLHSWERQGMDAYLRRLLRHMLPRDREGAGGSASHDLPEQPLLLFEGPAGPRQTLQTAALDRASFTSLEVRLGWLNDNLTLHRQLAEQEKRLTQLAQDAWQSRLFDQLREQARQARQDFEDSAQQTRGRVTSLLDELTDELSREIDSTVTRTHATAEEVRRLNRRLEALVKTREEMEETSDEIDRLQRQILAEAAQLKRTLDTLEESTVAPLLQRAESTRRSIQKRLQDQIDSLQQTRRRLLDALKKPQ